VAREGVYYYPVAGPGSGLESVEKDSQCLEGEPDMASLRTLFD